MKITRTADHKTFGGAHDRVSTTYNYRNGQGGLKLKLIMCAKLGLRTRKFTYPDTCFQSPTLSV